MYSFAEYRGYTTAGREYDFTCRPVNISALKTRSILSFYIYKVIAH